MYGPAAAVGYVESSGEYGRTVSASGASEATFRAGKYDISDISVFFGRSFQV